MACRHHITIGAMTVWKLFVEICFPIAFVLLVLLNVPAPRKFRAAIVKMVDRVLSFPLVGNMQLLHVVLICTGGAFGETIRQTAHLNRKRTSEMVETPNVVTGLLARRWRAERNFWLSFFCFTLWCLLAAFYRLQVQLLALEDQLAANGDDFGSVPPRKPVQPSAPPLGQATDGKPAAKKDA